MGTNLREAQKLNEYFIYIQAKFLKLFLVYHVFPDSSMLHFLFSHLAACLFERYRLALNSPETDVQEVVYDVTDVETSQAGNFYKLTNLTKHPIFDVSALPGILGPSTTA